MPILKTSKKIIVMSMKSGKMLAMLAILGALSQVNAGYESEGKNPTRPEDINGNPKQVIPKGCKEYWFNENGDFSTERMRHDEIVFKCIASNDKTAKISLKNGLKVKQNSFID
jgi:hypothetical protein